MRLTSSCGLVLLLVLSLPAAVEAAPGEKAPRCFGKPATVVGTPGPDRFSDEEEEGGMMLKGGNVVVAMGGDDRVKLYNGTGNIRICLGRGRDFSDSLGGTGGSGVWIDGGPGPDLIRDNTDLDFDGSGTRRIYGGRGADSLGGESSDDTLVGGPGSDRLYGFEGDDRISGGAGDDLVYSGPGADRIHGGDDDDTLYSDWGRYYPDLAFDDQTDRIWGGSGIDGCRAEVLWGCEVTSLPDPR